jgi:hypothetical protein
MASARLLGAAMVNSDAAMKIAAAVFCSCSLSLISLSRYHQGRRESVAARAVAFQLLVTRSLPGFTSGRSAKGEKSFRNQGFAVHPLFRRINRSSDLYP